MFSPALKHKSVTSNEAEMKIQLKLKNKVVSQEKKYIYKYIKKKTS